jgi:hypothetical protein
MNNNALHIFALCTRWGIPSNQILVSTRCKDFITQNLDSKIKTVPRVLAKQGIFPILSAQTIKFVFVEKEKT